MHRASNISNIGQGTITIIVTNRGGQSNRKKVHSRLLNSIRISLQYTHNYPAQMMTIHHHNLVLPPLQTRTYRTFDQPLFSAFHVNIQPSEKKEILSRILRTKRHPRQMVRNIYRQSLVKTPDIKNIKVVTFGFLLKFPTACKQLRQEQKFPIHSQGE